MFMKGRNSMAQNTCKRFKRFRITSRRSCNVFNLLSIMLHELFYIYCHNPIFDNFILIIIIILFTKKDKKNDDNDEKKK